MAHTFYLLCATRPEWGELKKRIPFTRIPDFPACPAYEGQFLHEATPSSLIRLFQTGIGVAKAKALLDPLLTPVLPENLQIIHFGLTGGLNASLQVGDILLAEQVVMEGQPPLAINSSQLIQAEKILQSLRFPYKRGTLLTSSEALATPDIKQKKGLQYGALGVDMEAYPIARACAERKIPYLSIRAVFDPWDWDLTELLDCHLVDACGNVDASRLTKELGSHMRVLFRMPRYQRAASQGNNALCRFLMETFAAVKTES